MRKLKLAILSLCLMSNYLPLNAQCTPGGITSYLWMKADAGVTGAAAITAWADQSGNARNLSQGTATNSPSLVTNAINFNPGLNFDGTNDFLIRAAGIFGASTQQHLQTYIVLRSDQLKAQSLFWETESSSASNARFNCHLPYSDGVLYYDVGNIAPGAGRVSQTWGGTAGNYHLWTFNSTTGATSPSGNRQAIYRNGLVISAGADRNNSVSFTGNNSAFTIGCNYITPGSPVEFYDGILTEMIVVNTAVTNAQQMQIQSYLALKYGITIDQTSAQNYISSDGTTVMWNSVTAGTYNNDIAGIGMDNTSCLNQKQSKSINTDDVITVGLGSIFSDNTSNTNTFSADKNFMTWANNNGAYTEQNSDLPSTGGYLKRIAREWKVQEVGTVGNVQLKADFSAATLTGGTVDHFFLLIDQDGDGNFLTGTIRTVKATSYAAGIATFDNVNFNHAEVFTFVTNMCTPGGIGPYAWYKATDGVTGTTSITMWSDQSGNSFNASQGNASFTPALVANGVNFNPCISFDGVNDFLDRTSIFGTSVQNDLNAYFVGNVTDVNKQNCAFREPGIHNASSLSNQFELFAPAMGTVYYDAGDNSFDPTNTMNHGYCEAAYGGSQGQYYLWTGNSTNGSTSPSGNKQGICRDGLLLPPSNPTSYGNSSAFNGNNENFRIGYENNIANDPTGGYYQGNIAEIIVVNSSLSAATQNKVHSYLCLKYGITLDQSILQNYLASDGTVVYPATTTHNGYVNDIAGIGRDDANCLVQKQSKSINSDEIVTIGLNSIAVTNNANAGTFTPDKTFFIWGNDNGALSGTTTDIGTTTNSVLIQSRLQREWYSREINSTGTMKMQVDFSTIPGNGDVSKLRLLVDQDGVFATGALAVSPSTFNNTTKIVEFDIDFTAGIGYYFTFGSIDIISTPLPVSLVLFDAVQNDKGVLIQWTVSNHWNSSYFIIERSNNGMDWQTVGTMPSSNSLGMKNYSLSDLQFKDGDNYYRLIEVSTSNEKKNHGIKMVHINTNQDFEWTVFPNPNKGNFNIYFKDNVKDIDHDKSQAYDFYLVDILGKEIFRSKIFEGNNEVKMPNIYAGTFTAKIMLQHKVKSKTIVIY